MSFDFVESFCCIFLHGFYFLFLALVYLFFFLFSYLKSITPFFCAINNNFSHQCPIKCYFFIIFFFLIMLRIGSSQPEVFRKRYSEIQTWFSEKVLVIFFFFFHYYYYYSLFGNLAKISYNHFELSVKLEDAYFAKKLLMFDFGILAYSEIYNPL